ncbi:MAG: sigma-70 family RNA polymerase sigma factor [Phreatobacter sp.]|uniref:sigma-70 family RNA polymerase sigma factor n=1 Tax=Phreatobacter sp. TaxID=1966341 RepID=UPI001A36ED79|nr:sigma-70 family RNA polymerase sigma factor [Phreatobacter sp.]MBL8567513.1 sigma-70 family RNA polymerase sigma factor [Phreatobacter sp.]
MASGGDAAAVFDAQRPRLVRIAYRMLGSVAEAEDVVQDAWLRWHQADRANVRDPAAFLARTVSRLSLDVLKSARVRREAYVGPWLPEPILVTEEEPEDDVTLTLMMALERLSPLERAAFLLHDVFGMPFEEIAVAVDRDPAACRQLAARARTHVRGERPRYRVEKERGLAIASAFLDASRSGDVGALKGLLAADVVLHSDGGGKRVAAQKPVVGEAVVTRFYRHWAEKGGYRRPAVLHVGLIDGLPGYVTEEADGIQVTVLGIEDGRIAAIYVVRNPDKLARLAAQFARV